MRQRGARKRLGEQSAQGWWCCREAVRAGLSEIARRDCSPRGRRKGVGVEGKRQRPLCGDASESLARGEISGLRRVQSGSVGYKSGRTLGVVASIEAGSALRAHGSPPRGTLTERNRPSVQDAPINPARCCEIACLCLLSANACIVLRAPRCGRVVFVCKHRIARATERLARASSRNKETKASSHRPEENSKSIGTPRRWHES